MKGPYPLHTGLAMESALLRRISSKVMHFISRSLILRVLCSMSERLTIAVKELVSPRKRLTQGIGYKRLNGSAGAFLLGNSLPPQFSCPLRKPLISKTGSRCPQAGHKP